MSLSDSLWQTQVTQVGKKNTLLPQAKPLNSSRLIWGEERPVLLSEGRERLPSIYCLHPTQSPELFLVYSFSDDTIGAAWHAGKVSHTNTIQTVIIIYRGESFL